MEEGMDTNGFENCLQRFEQMLSLEEEYYFDVSDLEELVDHYMMMCEFDKAERAIELAQHQHPGSSEFDLKQAELLIMNGNNDRALKLLNKFEQHDPLNPNMLVAKGSIMSKLKNHVEAIKYLKKALERSPEPSEIRLMISFEYQSLNKPKKALEQLKIALSEYPMRSSLINETAFCFDVMEMNDEAMEFFKNHTDKHPYCNSAWFNLGLFQMRKSDHESALDSFGFSNAIDPTDYLSIKYLAECYLELENEHKAIDIYNEALEMYPESVDCYLGLSEAWEVLGDHDNSESFCRKVLELDPENPDAWFRLASLKFQDEKFTESMEMVKRSIECDPDDPASWTLLGEVSMVHLLFDEAIAAYDKALKLDSGDSEIWLSKAISVFHNIDEQEGVAIMMDGIKHNTHAADLHYAMAAIKLASGRKQEGLLYLETALSMNRTLNQLVFQIYPNAIQIPEVLNLIGH